MPTQIPLDEEAVRQVLARALELERQHGSFLAETQVREIARELSISPAAIDQALAEYRSNVDNRAVVHPTSGQWRTRVVAAVVFGITLIGLALVFATARMIVPPQ